MDNGPHDTARVSLDDLIGRSYGYVVGTTVYRHKSADIGFISDIAEDAIMHNLFDWGFYNNHLNKEESFMFLKAFTSKALPELIGDLNGTLKRYFALTTQETVEWVANKTDRQNYTVEFIRTNLPSAIKKYDHYLKSNPLS
jgi:hypothetical protein